MNKWYRLGENFSKNFTEITLREYLSKNNLWTANSGIEKDFSEKDYKKLCKLADTTPEVEEKQYMQGERKYFFYWGFSKGGKNE